VQCSLLAFFFGFADVDLDPFALAFVDLNLLALAALVSFVDVDSDPFEAKQ